MAFSAIFEEGEILYETVNSILFPVFGFAIGLVLVLPFVLLRWRELYHWLPTHSKPPTDKLERALLLYTPVQRGRLVYHVLFHACLVFGYLALIISLFSKSADGINCVTLPFLIFALGIRWLAWRAARKSDAVLAPKPG
jgi:hypothetical protein